MTRRLSLACTIALIAPVCLVTAAVAWVGLGERVGARPFAGLTPINSAEAAALGRAADLLRFLRDGEDPRRVYPIRRDVISPAVLRATTLEAAVWSRQAALVELLDSEGAIQGDEERRMVACLAVDLDVDDVVEYLARHGVAHCEPGRALDGVLARTTDNR
jgi:hypothetical protein